MEAVYENIITYMNPRSPTSEAIRCLRTNIQFLSVDKRYQVISMTSSIPKEGKTFLTVNLAVVTAQSNKKTLVVDCDLRHPSVSKMFGINPTEGLSSILTSKESDPKKIPFYNTGINNLTLLTSGPMPTNPAELLESETLDRLLSSLRNEFDIIYLDNPPLLSVTDPLIMAKKSDGVILVTAAGITSKSGILRSYSILKGAHINVIGVVLNMADTGMHGYGKYGYGAYGYYYNK